MAHEKDDLPIGKLATITVAGSLITLALAYLAIGSFYQMEKKYAKEHNQNLGAEAASMREAQQSQLGDIDGAMNEMVAE